VAGFFGWYMLLAIMVLEMRLPFSLPVFDLSHYWPRADVPIAAGDKNV
jgi:hypothetical protein